MIPAFPKIFAIGTDYIRDIFKEEVEVTEKIDGSQFSFGKINGELFIRSKGKQLFVESPEKMFAEGIAYVDSISHKIPDDTMFHCEYLKKPKHNVLKYDRIPKNHLILFGVRDVTQKFYDDLPMYAELLDIEYVPRILINSKIDKIDQLMELLDTDSTLGGCKIEGVVVKNYHRKFLLGGQPMPLMAGKFVSEAFKEVHRSAWKEKGSGKNRLQIFYESFRTEARWEKAVQAIRDSGDLLNEPKDIGNLIKHVHTDIEAEEKEDIKEFLWKEFNKDLKRRAVAGLPEWYKEKLANRSFEEDTND